MIVGLSVEINHCIVVQGIKVWTKEAWNLWILRKIPLARV